MPHLPEIIAGSITLITCGSLWLAERVVEIVHAAEEAESTELYPNRLNDSHDMVNCALCGAVVWRMKRRSVGDRVRWTCSKCKGTYYTPSKERQKVLDKEATQRAQDEETRRTRAILRG